MFTGLIRDKGTVLRNAGGDILVKTVLAGEVEPGDSVAVDGSCLTVTRGNPGSRNGELLFHCSAETLGRTIASGYRSGTAVNLELPVSLSDLLHGHLVTGHVDQSGTVLSLSRKGPDATAWISFSPEYSSLLVEKGSVTVNGISLTVASISGGKFSVTLISETLKRTNAGEWRSGTPVNLEFDIVGKYLKKQLQAAEGTERLRNYLES